MDALEASIEERLEDLGKRLNPILQLFSELQSVLHSAWGHEKTFGAEISQSGYEMTIGGEARRLPPGVPPRITLSPEAQEALFNFYWRLRCYLITEKLGLPAIYMEAKNMMSKNDTNNQFGETGRPTSFADMFTITAIFSIGLLIVNIYIVLVVMHRWSIVELQTFVHERVSFTILDRSNLAGVQATSAVICVISDYFNSSRRLATVTHPNMVGRVCAGILALASDFFWILSALKFNT